MNSLSDIIDKLYIYIYIVEVLKTLENLDLLISLSKNTAGGRTCPSIAASSTSSG